MVGTYDGWMGLGLVLMRSWVRLNCKVERAVLGRLDLGLDGPRMCGV